MEIWAGTLMNSGSQIFETFMLKVEAKKCIFSEAANKCLCCER